MRPKILHIGTVMYWVLRTYNPDTQILKDADSMPTVAVRKNGAAVGDSVTIAKRPSTTGIYDCAYNPASEVEGDKFTVEETATVSGTTGTATYANGFEFEVVALERGTDAVASTVTLAASQPNYAPAKAGDAMTLGGAVRVKLDTSQPDYAPAKAGDEMALPNATLTALFADADVAALVASITAQFDNAGDLPVATIAAKAAQDTLAAILANGQILQLIADASAAQSASASIDDKLTTNRAAKLDLDLPTVANVTAAAQSVIDHGDGDGDWGASSGGGQTQVVVTIPAIEAASMVLGVEVTRYRGTQWQIAVEDLASIPAKCYCTVKRGGELDAKSILQAVVTNPAAGTDGLKVINGATATAANASIAFTAYQNDDDETRYRGVLTVAAVATAAIQADTYRLDFKDVDTDTELAECILRIINPVTLATG